MGPEAVSTSVNPGQYPVAGAPRSAFCDSLRTSDDPNELTRLADMGHIHQEALRCRETWIASEDRWVARIFTEVRADLGGILGAACNDAWSTNPVKSAAAMTLGGWGPSDVEAHLERFQMAAGFRFGWRRLPALLGVRWGHQVSARGGRPPAPSPRCPPDRWMDVG